MAKRKRPPKQDASPADIIIKSGLIGRLGEFLAGPGISNAEDPIQRLVEEEAIAVQRLGFTREEFLNMTEREFVAHVRAKQAEIDGAPVVTEPPRKQQGRGEQIDGLLQARGWSLLDLAQQAKIDYKTAKQYRKTTRSYTNTRKQIARAFEVAVDELP